MKPNAMRAALPPGLALDAPWGVFGGGGKILENKFSDGQMSVISTNSLRAPRLPRQQTRIGAGGISCALDFPAQIEPIRSLIVALHSGSLTIRPENGCVLPDRFHPGVSADCMQNRHPQRGSLESREPSLSILTSKPADVQENRRAKQSQMRTQSGLKTAMSDTNLEHEAE